MRTSMRKLLEMHAAHHQELMPSALARELRSTWVGQSFNRRTIVVRDPTKRWVLFGCAVRPTESGAPTLHQKFEFEDAVLVSDSFPASDFAAFVGDLGNKLTDLTGKPTTADIWPGCEEQAVAIQNYWMEGPGVVYSWKQKLAPNPAHLPLLAVSGPYYSDVHEAAGDWLQLREHHGQSDARKGYVMLLLPETRAFIADFAWAADDERLQLQIAGSLVASAELTVKGAYSQGKRITQVQAPVEGGTATLTIPRGADKLELFLMGARGLVYEQHRETLALRGEKRFLGNRQGNASERVMRALKEGEGVQIEFKEFVDLPKRKEPVKDKSKLDQLVRTVAAFANTEGGTIFIGISDDMQVVGVAEGVRRWANEDATTDVMDRYTGALRALITDALHLPTDLSTSVVVHEDQFVVLVDVPRSEVPVSLKDDGRLLQRVGANNRRVPPAEWSARLARWT